MKNAKLTKSQINRLPAQYTFVDGQMVRKDAKTTRTSTEDWEAMAADVVLEAGTDDDEMLFAKR